MHRRLSGAAGADLPIARFLPRFLRWWRLRAWRIRPIRANLASWRGSRSFVARSLSA